MALKELAGKNNPSKKQSLNFSSHVVSKARGILAEKKVEMEEKGEARYFTVKTENPHQVIFKKGSWICDCQYFSLKTLPCSHIAASYFFLLYLSQSKPRA